MAPVEDGSALPPGGILQSLAVNGQEEINKPLSLTCSTVSRSGKEILS